MGEQMIRRRFTRYTLILFFMLFLTLAHVLPVYAATLTLHPSGSAASDNATYYGGTAADALDSSDGDTSYGQSVNDSTDLYLEVDDSSKTNPINSVTVYAVAKRSGGNSTNNAFRIGITTNSSSYFDSGHDLTGTSYVTFSGDTYTTNPQSSAAWTWSEVNSLVAIVNSLTSTDFNVTELYVVVDYTPVPSITIARSMSTISDPVNNTTAPLAIPGAVMEYSVVVANDGDASPDADSVYVTAPVDSVNEAYDVNTGVSFTDGSTSSALSLGTVTYSSTAAPGPYVYDYTPVPDGQGYDGSVTSIKINTTGTMAYGGSPSPSFTVKFRTKVE